MYSQTELDEAVAAGAISAEAANGLRNYVELQRSTFVPDEEQFRLITGFNDIFVSIAAAILLFAMGWIGHWAGDATGLSMEPGGPNLLMGAFPAITAWALASYFTAKRRMALPSILLLLAFIAGVAVTTAAGLGLAIGVEQLANNEPLIGIVAAVSAAVAAGAAWLHWRRFRVPITIAALAGAIVG
ncbi:MAG TPA: hypothetical protein VF637_10715, partial [Sphingomicrobium sp.]